MAGTVHYNLGRMAIRLGLITQSQFEECLVELSRDPQKTLIQVLLQRKLLTSEQLQKLEQDSRLSSEETRDFKIDPRLLKDMPPEVRARLGDPHSDIGRYVLLEKIAQGGTGSVYRSWQKDLARVVAVKFLDVNDDAYLKRFKQEAQVLARLDHANIAKVYEVGEHNGRPYIAMQFVEGTSLDQLRLEIGQTLHVTLKAAWAIQYAHSQGIIHRDVKPHNIMVDRKGQVYVLDFGLAKRVAGKDASITVTGELVGTPPYMSPEQVNGLPLDGRTDVYSLGATLYRMLTGRPPHVAEDPIETLLLVRNQEPPWPSQINREIDQELEGIVMKALAKDRAKRYQNCEALAVDIDRYLLGGRLVARPVSGAEKFLRRIGLRRLAVASISLAALFGLIVIINYLQSSKIRELVRSGDEMMDRGEPLKAMTYFDDALKLRPSDTGIQEKRLRADMEKRRQDDQVRRLSFERFKREGHVSFEERNYDKAYFYFQEASILQEGDAECRQGLENCQIKRKETFEARVRADMAQRLRVMADESFRAGEYVAAKLCYGRLDELEPDAEVTRKLEQCAQLLADRGDADADKKRIQAKVSQTLKSAALDARPSYDALVLSALALRFAPDDRELRDLKDRSEQAEGQRVREQEADGFSRRGDEAWAQERFDQAAACYELALRARGTDPVLSQRILDCRRHMQATAKAGETLRLFDLYRTRAKELFDARRWEEARAFAEEALRLRSDEELATLRTSCLERSQAERIEDRFAGFKKNGDEAFNLGQLLKALLWYEEARKVKPKDKDINDTIKTTIAKLTAKSSDPERDNVRYLVTLGDAALAGNDYDAAIQYYEAALKLRPNDQEIKSKKLQADYSKMKSLPNH